MSKDYEVTVKVRNGRLLRKMRECGFHTSKSLADAAGLDQTCIAAILNIKISALRQNGTLRTSVNKICEALRCLPEDVIPRQHLETPLKTNVSSFEADLADVEALTASLRSVALPPNVKVEADEARALLFKSFERLSPREERIIRLRFGLAEYAEDKTLQEVAKEFGLSGARIRTLEKNALHKLKGGARVSEQYQEMKSIHDTLCADEH